VAEKLHKLAALRRLRERMSELEKQRRDRLERGDNPGEADRDAAQLALTDVVTFFLDHDMQSEPLVRLLSELAALSAGSSPSPMLAPAVTSGGEHGAASASGREGYLHMRNIPADRSPVEQDLKKILDILAQSLPS
jgi:hypothetical protein